MKTYTTRDDLIQMRGQIDQTITRMELSNREQIDQKDTRTELQNEAEIRSMFLALFRAVYAILDFIIRKTWGI